MSKRQQIVDKVVARMQAISVANGYQTDLGASVYDFETNFDDADLPALSVCDLIAAHELANAQPTAANQIDTLSLQLRVFCKADTRPAFLRTAIADIWRAIKVDPRWDGAALYTIPKRSGIVLNDEAFQIGGAAVEIEIYIFNLSYGS